MKLYEFTDDLTGKIETVYENDLDGLGDRLRSAFDLDDDGETLDALSRLETFIADDGAPYELDELQITLNVEDAG